MYRRDVVTFWGYPEPESKNKERVEVLYSSFFPVFSELAYKPSIDSLLKDPEVELEDINFFFPLAESMET
jgi:hypothetical protein